MLPCTCTATPGIRGWFWQSEASRRQTAAASAILVGITVFRGVMLGSFATVMSCMSSVAMGSVSMMGRSVVVTFIVMLRSFTMVVSGFLVVFGG